MQSTEEDSVKPWSLVAVSYQDGLYVHRSCGTFFQEDGAKKEMTLMLGNEWKGGDTMDDLC